jgi:ABC-type lipoprotein export system ATPase subunit
MTNTRLEATSLSLRYRRSETIIHDWNAKFEAGAVTTLTGPSGRGKSTLLYALGLMLRPASGQVSIDGKDVSGLSERERAKIRGRMFGFVFQDAALDPGRSVLENVLEGGIYRRSDRAADKRRALTLLDDFGVSARANHRPGQISGGQAQRISLCRALLHEPPFLLADEPTGNLDAKTGALVTQAFQQHARAGATVIIATHDPALVSLYDRNIEI